MTATDEQLIEGDVGRAQPRAFTATELVACPACERANPPTRANCLYCGGGLGTKAETRTAGPALDVAEVKLENVLNLVTVAAAHEAAEAGAAISRLVNLTPSECQSLLRARVAPLFSTKSATQLQALSDSLRAAGIDSLTVSDDQLKVETPSKEIAGLTLSEDGLIASVRRREPVSVTWSDIKLIVTGRLYSTTTEVEQKRDKSKQVLDERQLTSDEAVLDLYLRGDDCGWRIRAGSFDFSCLGAEKKPTAFENFRALVDLVRRNAMSAVFEDGFMSVRSALNKIWPPEPRASSTEKRRTLRREVNATATTTDNELQFTRYSRLVWVLQNAQPDDHAQQP